VSRAWFVVLALLVVGCSGGTKVGGSARHVTVLTIANHDGEGRDLGDYISAVNRLSGGSLRLRLDGNWRPVDVDYDRRTLADVRAGKVDLAKIRAGAFDTFGVDDFRPLLAPFLVDSLALEAKVLASPFAADMLPSVRRLGVAGVALLPGEPVRPFGQRRRFLSLSDYRGALFGTAPSRLAADTLAALGSRPRTYVNELPYAFDGAALDLRTIEESGYDTKVTSLTGNVVFWPRAFVVVGNESVLEKLTANQRDVLRLAGREALTNSIARLRTRDPAEAETLCGRGQIKLVDASADEVAQLHEAVRPVYAELERNRRTRAAVDEIRSLKRTVPTAPATRCVPPPARETATAPLDGTWTMTASRKRAGPIDAGRYRLVLRRGRVILFHVSPPKWGGPPGGTFTVRGPLVEFRLPDGVGVYRWNLYRATLLLRYAPGQERGAPNFTFAPWHRVS
jgi:TRAP-type C4-dicarboxylate transport system substrate-binding protein